MRSSWGFSNGGWRVYDGAIQRGVVMGFRFSLLLACSLLAPLTTHAEVAAEDPPARIGRLNWAEGAVSFQAAGVDDWVEAPLNRPVVAGDNLWADNDARAELHVGSTAI